MQNVYEIGLVIPGPMPDQGTFGSGDLNAGRKAQADGSGSASEFDDVFEAEDKSPFEPNGPRSPEDDLGKDDLERLDAASDRIRDPENEVFELGAFFKGLASGDIDINDFVPAGLQLGDEIKNMFAQWPDMARLDPSFTSPAGGPDAMTAVNMMDYFKSLAASLPPGSEASKAVLAFEALVMQFQGHLSDAQQMTALGVSPQTKFNGLGAGGSLAQVQAGLPVPPGVLGQASKGISPDGQPPALGLDGPGAQNPVTGQAATWLGDPLTQSPLAQSASPTSADQSAQSLSGLIKEADATRKFETIKPAMNALSSPYGGSGINAPRPLAALSGQAAEVAPGALPFDALQSEHLGMEMMGPDPAVEIGAREARTPHATIFGSQMPAAHMAQSQQIARQIAIAIQTRASGNFEISLSPAELGTVRISLTTAETGMVVNIQAERQETLDLMRRNADILAEHFRDLGYDGTSFSFEGSDGQQEKHGAQLAVIRDGSDAPQDLSASMDPNAPPEPAVILSDGSVDIRI